MGRLKQLYKNIVAKLKLGFVCLGVFLSLQCSAEEFIDFKTSLSGDDVHFYLNDKISQPTSSLRTLRYYVEAQNKQFLFAMNAGMYMANKKPLGLYIENTKTLSRLNTRQGLHGNFYIQPNGVFAIGSDGAVIVKTSEWAQYAKNHNVKYATQSGPILVSNKVINPAIQKASASKTIRNGVCITDRNLIFTVSRVDVSFSRMAQHFKTDLGCNSALYLDGAISDVMWPQKGIESNSSDLGPMIAVVK